MNNKHQIKMQAWKKEMNIIDNDYDVYLFNNKKHFESLVCMQSVNNYVAQESSFSQCILHGDINFSIYFLSKIIISLLWC